MIDTELFDPPKTQRILGVPQRLWRGMLVLLNPIGLRKERPVSREAQLARLRLYHAQFRRLISANHSFLETLVDLEEKRLSHHDVVDPSFVKRNAIRVLSDVHAMVEGINIVSGDRYASLKAAFERIADTLTEALEDKSEPLPGSQGFQLLEKAIPLISHLNLTDPDSVAFTPDQCVTFHDLAHFVHEKSCREMLMMGDNVGDLRRVGYKLGTFPTGLYIVDLGGGLRELPKRRTLKRSQIASAPFSALLTGMFDEKISHLRPRPINSRGFWAVVREKMFKRRGIAGLFGEPGYAVVSDKYLNLTSGIGNHYSVLDSYCSDSANKNYIAFSFSGGAADGVRRNRKAKALAKVFRSLDFLVFVRENRVCARFHEHEREEIEAKLDMIGRMFTRSPGNSEVS